MAEAHPVGFQWVMKAKERGAKVIHVDPRFTRPARWRTCTCRSAPAPTSRSSAGSSTTCSERARLPRVRRGVHERRDDRHRRLPGHRGPRRPVLRLRPGDAHLRHPQLAVRGQEGRRRGDGDQHEARETAAGMQPSRTARRSSHPQRDRRSSTRTASSRSSSGTSPATRPRW